MHINSLSQLRRYKLLQRVRQFDRHFNLVRSSSSGATGADVDEDDEDESDDEPFTGNNAPPAPVVPPWPVLFDLDCSCTSGRIVLVWSSSSSCAGVHFLDPSMNLYFVSSSFEDYKRVMLMHLGIRDWILAFSEAGMMQMTIVREEREHTSNRVLQCCSMFVRSLRVADIFLLSLSLWFDSSAILSFPLAAASRHRLGSCLVCSIAIVYRRRACHCSVARLVSIDQRAGYLVVEACAAEFGKD